MGNTDKQTVTRIRGVNHVLRFEDKEPQDNDDAWGALWRVWDWTNWVQPQLDDIAKVGNAARFWGSTCVLALNNITLDQYLDRWMQVLDYTNSVGLLLYPCGGDLLHWGDYSLKDSVKCYSELSALFATYPHVIGMDIANEAPAFPWNQLNKPKADQYNQPEPYDEFLQELGAAVRANGIPITYSRNLWSSRQWTQEGSLDSKGDFLDFHVYYAPDPGDSLPVYDTDWGKGKQMLVGEFGMGMNVSSDVRDAYYAAIKQLTVSDPNCIGAFAWSAYDPSTPPIWQTGLFDRQRLPRDDVVDAFMKFPIA